MIIFPLMKSNDEGTVTTEIIGFIWMELARLLAAPSHQRQIANQCAQLFEERMDSRHGLSQ